MPITIVDLSSDDAEESTATGGASLSHYSSQERITKFTKPPAFVDLSDDDGDYNPTVGFSSSLNRMKKSEASSPVSTRKSDSSFNVPEVTPVNSLSEKFQARNCLQDDIISKIVTSFNSQQQHRNSLISEQLLS